MSFDHLIHHALVLTMEPGAAPLVDGYVAVKGRKIAAVGQATATADLPRAVYAWDARGQLVMPGLINCHCHAAMTLFRGLADDLPLLAWLHQHIFPAEARWVNREFVYTGALLAAAEMLRGGITTVADAYFYEDVARQAFLAAGLRAVVAQGIVDFPTPDVPNPQENLRVAEEFIQAGREFTGAGLISTLFCHAPYTCSAATLTAAKEITRQQDLPFFIHVAETAEEVARSQEANGLTPVAYLDHLGLLDAQTVVVHAVWLTEADQDLLAQRQVKVVHCPESNLKLAAGIAPVAALQRRRVTLGLGTDGAASNNNLDLWGEMSLAARLHKVATHDPAVLPAPQVLAMATCDGAQVLGLAEVTGSLRPGKEADLILVDLQQPHLTPLYDPYSHLVYAAQAADVTAVMVAGRWLLRDRQFLSLDWPALASAVRRWTELLKPESNLAVPQVLGEKLTSSGNPGIS